MDIIHQGECGQNAKWSLTSENTLIISGEGRMKDYETRSSLGIGGEGPFMNVINEDYLVPWRDYGNDITQIVIEEGITYIGSFAFCNFQSLESVILSHSLSEIGICSFAVCPNLKEINLNSDISIAEWAFRGSPLLDNTNPEPLDDATKRDLDDIDEMVKEFDFLGKPTEETNSLFQTDRTHINITNTGIYYDFAIKSENDCGTYRYDCLFPKSQIHKTWKDCFFCPEAEHYFQKIYLDSYKEREQFADKRKHESIEVDNYYLALIIRKAIAKYQFNQNVAKLRDEVTDKDIEAYIKTINEELNQVKFGLKESESLKKTMFWLWLFLENNLDCENTLSGLGFDNVKQIHTWLNSTKGISYSDSFYNLKKPYFACMEKMLEKNDPQVIKTWYVISNSMPPGYDEFMRLDKMYIQELHTKHLWLINNLEFDIKFKMMLPPCYIRNCGNTDMLGKSVIKNLRKDIIKEFPLSSLYVEDELLRGADMHIWDFLINDKNDLEPYIKKEIYNDNKKNEILKYIGLSGGEDKEGVNSNSEFNSDEISEAETLSTVSKDEKISVSEEKESSPKSYIQDSNIKKQEQFVRVLDTKYNNGTGNNNEILYHNLEKLYHYLINGCSENEIVIKPCIAKDTPKELFIYRFSGIRCNEQKIETNIQIKWTGKETIVFLGYLARCLFSDEKYSPDGFEIFASFFIQDSKKKMNLASAKDCGTVNFDEKKSNLPPSFVKAVLLLRLCGFCNVECTKARKH